MTAPYIYKIGMQNQPTNPAYLITIPKPIVTVDTSAAGITNTRLSVSNTKGLWIVAFNFGVHPIIAQDGRWVTAISYNEVSPNDNSLVVVTSSTYLNTAAVTLQGGTIGTTYTINCIVTLNNSNTLSSSTAVTVLA